MAKKEEKSKVVIERMYNVPLRKEYMKAPRWNRTKKAVKALVEFLQKHMKSEDVRLGRYANELLWKHGIKNPPHHIKVNATKDDKGVVRAELVVLPGKAKREQEEMKNLLKAKDDKDKQKKETTKKEKDTKKDVPKKGSTEAKEAALETKIEEVKEEQEEKAKDIQKEEIKELKKGEGPKEHPKKVPPEQSFQETHPTAPRHV